jgi:sugar/nucleoside kinase (ribokinase family)
MRRIHGALPRIDYLVTNEEEAAKLTGKEAPAAAAQDLLARGPQAVAIKRGQQGAMLATRGGITEFPAYRVEVRDTTCAGDSFAAGFLLGISRGWPLDESLMLANAAGAMSTTQLSHLGITSLEDLLQLIKTQPSSPTIKHQLSPSNRS